GPAGERLFEEALLLEDLAEYHTEHPRVPGVRHLVDARPPAVDERLRVAGILVEDRTRDVAAAVAIASRRFGLIVGHGPAEIRDRLPPPGELRVLAVDDVLVSVVLVVLRDEARTGLVLQEGGELLAVELLQQRDQVAHEFCFSLQVMQTRVHGIALSRA